MDGFSYHDIFATKGLEYLVVIAFLFLLIPFWILLNRKAKQSNQVQSAPGFINANSLRIPQGLFFSKYHTWAFLEKSGIAKIGLDDLLLQFTGEVTLNGLRKSGKQVQKGDVLTTISHNGKSLRILSPISGEIQRANEILSDDPTFLRQDPYRKGWMYSVQPTNWKADISNCFLAEDATRWAVRELDRFKDFLAVSVTKYLPQPSNVVLQDGGELLDHPLAELPQEVWQDFQEAFLS